MTNLKEGRAEVYRKFTITVLTVLAALAFASIAFAADGQTVPHGGWYAEDELGQPIDTLNNACLSCHDIHEAGADYVLLREETVTQTCGTCHTLFQGNLTDSQGEDLEPYIGDYFGVEPDIGTAATLTAYNVDSEEDLRDDLYGGHRLGLGPGDDFLFADETEANANYIPGSTSTLLALSSEGNEDFVAATTFQATGGLYCASCHTPHGDYGNILRDSYPDGNISTEKILSSNPNHAVDEDGNPIEVEISDWNVDAEAANWCTSCHDKRRSESPDNEETTHINHPDEFCLTCHSNYSGSTEDDNPVVFDGLPTDDEVDDNDDDFPHTSPVQNLLSAVPDELCIGCHTEGQLP